MGFCESLNNSYSQPENINGSPKQNINEKNIKGKVCPVDIVKNERIKIQLRNCICKINEFQNVGTGFLCKIPYPNGWRYLPVLITNKNIIDADKILNKKIDITFDDDKVEKEITITQNRKIYSSKKYNITIIEIFPQNDEINEGQFLEIDMRFGETNQDGLDSTISKNVISDKSIYILQYVDGKECSKIFGTIEGIEGDIIKYNCLANSGGPILLLSNEKVIGIIIDFYKGILLRESINEFNKAFQNKKTIEINENINYIDCVYKIEDRKKFNLLNDYENITEGIKKLCGNLYNEGKKKKKFLEENIIIYIDSQRIPFTYKYETNKKIISVRFVFKQILNDLSLMFYYCENLESIDLSSYNTTNITNMAFMFCECLNLKYVNLTSFKSNNAINMEGAYQFCLKLKLIDFPSSNIINVTNMEYMFNGCQSLESLNLSSLNTTYVKNMSEIFENCSSLKSINISSFNTSNVTDMSYMFCFCHNLKSINLSKFNTKNVTNMSNMFGDCRSLISLDLSSFNTSKVTNMGGMFMFCLSIKSIDLSSFNTVNVIDMGEMFNSCESLQNINLSTFNTVYVKNMKGMFTMCKSLKSLDLSSFKTCNVINIDSMFIGCFSLESIDLSSFNTINVNKESLMVNQFQILQSFDQHLAQKNYPSISNIFWGCLALKNIKCKDKYILEMFEKEKNYNEYFNTINQLALLLNDNYSQ